MRKAKRREVTQTVGVPKLNQPEVGVVASSRFFNLQPVPRSGMGVMPDCTQQGSRVKLSGFRACGTRRWLVAWAGKGGFAFGFCSLLPDCTLLLGSDAATPTSYHCWASALGGSSTASSTPTWPMVLCRTDCRLR